MLTFLQTITPHATRATALVLIHAFPLSSEMYRKATLNITKALPDLPVITIDMPGFGNAPLADSWTMDSAMQDAHKQLQDQAISSIVLGGTSMGGYAVFSFYHQFPEMVRGLIFSNTKAEADTPEAKADREVFAKDVEKRGHEAVYERMLDKLTSASAPPELKDFIKRSIATQPTEAIAAALRAMALRSDSSDLLPKIQSPVLVVASEKDQLIKEESLQTIAKKTADSTYRRFPGIGHLAPLEGHEEWAGAVVTFLKNKELI